MQLNKTQETPLDSDIAKLVDFMDKEIVILTVLPYKLTLLNDLNCHRPYCDERHEATAT